MCGIAGYFGPKELKPERRRACLAAMHRRGPDAAGEIHRQNGAGRHLHLLHSRLKIIDLDERANQPYALDGGHLAFNGELYNYVELRETLRKEGHAFATTSDTEVLARNLAIHGAAGLDVCEGMWAFAWYDAARETLLLSRDRFGEKPLYIHEADGGIYFGSEPKFIFELMGRRLPINMAQVTRYLVNGYKALYKRPATFFEGLGEIAPGALARFDADGGRQDERYWTPQIAVVDDTMTYEQAVAGAREALVNSVRLRLRADVPIAFCLSGGVDSNALIAIAKRVLDYDVHGFTIMNTDARYEERDMVEASVTELGLRHTAIPVETDDFLPNLRGLVRQHDAPVYTITYYAQWRLMEAVAEQGYKVSVSGTAADELFSGYYDHHTAYLYELRDDPARHAAALADWRREVAPIVRNPFLQDPDYFYRDPDARDHIYLNAQDFAGYLTFDWAEAFEEERYCAGLLRNRMANELFHESVPPILHEDDLNAMYFSIENRSPFFDRGLFDWCQKIPTRHLVQNGRAKAVLRDAVRGIAPDAVIDNPRKVGFNAPLRDYLNVRDNSVRASLLDDSPIYEYVRKDRIERLIDKDELPNSESKFLFYFVNAKIFLEEFGR